jgi:hypothetical protein
MSNLAQHCAGHERLSLRDRNSDIMILSLRLDSESLTRDSLSSVETYYKSCQDERSEDGDNSQYNQPAVLMIYVEVDHVASDGSEGASMHADKLKLECPWQ